MTPKPEDLANVLRRMHAVAQTLRPQDEEPATFEYLLVPPKGWTDIGATRVFYRELKRGPQYLCRYCGEINEPRHPNFHKPGCPGVTAQANQITGAF